MKIELNKMAGTVIESGDGCGLVMDLSSFSLLAKKVLNLARNALNFFFGNIYHKIQHIKKKDNFYCIYIRI